MNTDTGDVLKNIANDGPESPIGNIWEDETGQTLLFVEESQIEPITADEAEPLLKIPKDKRPTMLRELRTMARMKEKKREEIRNDPRTALRNEAQKRGKIRSKKDKRKKRQSRRDRKRNN